MSLNKYLPEGPFVLIGTLGVILTSVNIVEAAAGAALGFLVFGAIGVYATVRLIKKLKAPATPQ